MLIAGAGGHALEVLDEWEKLLPNEEFVFLDELNFNLSMVNETHRVIHDHKEVKLFFEKSCNFSLGVGSPNTRFHFFEMFQKLGGYFKPLHAESSQISKTAVGKFDAMAFSFVGPKTRIGLGTLVNTRAHIHHDSVIGDFVEIGPGAMILGQVAVGNFVRIGAGAVILPNIKIGKNAVIGAGSVVSRDVPPGVVVKGVPAK